MSERYSPNVNSLERGADQPHVLRYLLARGWVNKNDTVIDCACGPGYGSKILAQVAKQVYSFDKATVVLKNAGDNISMVACDLEQPTNFKPYKPNVFVSIETIEHLSDPQKFLDEVVEATPDKIIISSPNKDTAGENEFHLSNVKLSDLEKMMTKYPDYFYYGHVLMGYCYVAFFVHKDAKVYEDLRNT